METKGIFRVEVPCSLTKFPEEDGAKFTHNRKVFTQENFDDAYHGKSKPPKSLKERIKQKQDNCNCSKRCLWKVITKYFPFINIMKNYDIKTDLFSDVIAGSTVGIMQIPQGMAYAMLANLSPVFGLYTSIFPIVIYFFFGTSRHISLGALAVASLLMGNAVAMADCESKFPEDGNWTSSENGSSSGKFTELELCQIGTATSVTLLAGLILIGMSVLRLGFVTIYLSESITRGFMTGSAFHVFCSQLKNCFGIPIAKHHGPLKLIWILRDWVVLIPGINWCAFIICVTCIIILYITKEFINPKVKAKIKVPVPIELILVILATVAVHYGQFVTKYDVAVVGDIPTGIPVPAVPPMENLGAIASQSIVIAIVNFAIAISMAQIFAKKHAYTVDSNQELLALGICNTGSSFLHSFTAGASLSRSSVQEGAGGVTQLAGIISAGLLLLVLFFIAPLFQSLPSACLASVIMVALKPLFLQFKDLVELWKVDKIDFLNWLVVCISVIFLDVEMGIFIGIGCGLLSVLFRQQRPYTCILGRVPNTDIYKNTKIYEKAHEIPGIKIFRVEASLYYVNKHNVASKLYEKTGINPIKLRSSRDKAQKRKVAQEKRIKATENKKKKQDENGNVPWQNDVEVGHTNGHVNVHEYEKKQPDLKFIIIDCSMMSFVDYDGVTKLSQFINEYKEVGITVCLAGPIAGVRDMLERAGFYKKSNRKCVFPTVHDAVLTAMKDMDGPIDNNVDIPSVINTDNVCVISTRL